MVRIGDNNLGGKPDNAGIPSRQSIVHPVPGPISVRIDLDNARTCVGEARIRL
jgi:hypothetical protein